MAQENQNVRKVALGINSSELIGRSLTRREREQYRFIKRALRNPGNRSNKCIEPAMLSVSDQQFIQSCLAQPRSES